MNSTWLLVTPRLTIEAGDPVAPVTFVPSSKTSLRVTRRADEVLVADVIVRIEPDEPTAEVSIVVVEPVRRRGYATEVLAHVVDHLLDAHRFDRVIALVPESHRPARRLFERNAFSAVARDGAELVYSRRRIAVSDESETERVSPPNAL